MKGKRKTERTKRAFAWEGLLAACVVNLATTFTSMYGMRLGAGPREIGFLGSFPQLAAMFVLIPGMLRAGRAKNARSPLEKACLLTGLFYGLAVLAPWAGGFSVALLILASSLGNCFLNLYNANYQNYFSLAVPLEERNEIYSERTRRSILAAIIVQLATGLILGSASSETLRLRLYQASYLTALFVALLQFRVIRSLPEADNLQAGTAFSDVKQSARRLWKDKKFMSFYWIILLFHAGWYFAWPLFFFAQVDYCGADERWLAFFTVTASLSQVLTMPRWTQKIDRKGPDAGLIAGMAGLCLNPLGAITASFLPAGWKLPGYLILNTCTTASFGSFQLALLQCILKEIPQENLNINLALFNTSLLAANALMQLLGVASYQAFGQDHRAICLSLSIAFSIRALGTLLFWLRSRKEA